MKPNLIKVAEMPVNALHVPTDFTDHNDRVLSQLELIAQCEELEHGADGIFLASSGLWLSPEAREMNSTLARDVKCTTGRDVGHFTVAIISRRPPLAA